MPYETEALAWLLENKNKKALASNYFGATENAIAAVRKLYAMGAVKVTVWVAYDERWRREKEGGDYSDRLFVYGPEGPPERRKKLTETVRSITVSAEEGIEPDPGEGPVYELNWD